MISVMPAFGQRSITMTIAWAWLVLAGVCEFLWGASLKRFGYALSLGGALTLVMTLLSILLLQHAMKTLPLATSYAVWTGIGSVGTVIWGIAVAGESRSPARIGCLLLIIVGIVGLKLV